MFPSLSAGLDGKEGARSQVADRAGEKGWLSFDELLLESESRAGQRRDNLEEGDGVQVERERGSIENFDVRHLFVSDKVFVH